MLLNNLAADLSTRYKQLGVMQDLDEAIVLGREALSLRPRGHPDRSMSLNNLGVCLSTRYNQLGVIQDLDEAIVLGREALSLEPQGHPHRSNSLRNLAGFIEDRFTSSKQLGDQEQLFSLYAQLTQLNHAISPTDLSAARAWICVAEDSHHPTILFAYETSLRLLCQYLTTLPSLPQHRPILTNLLSSIAMDVFSACLQKDSPPKAVELLEQGRGVFWNQLPRLRSPLDDVVTSGMPGMLLADQFRCLDSRIRSIVDSPGPDQHEQLCRLTLEMQRVRTTIRELPGSSRFLLPFLFSDLKCTASDGPVIIVNASQYSCDVLVIMLGCDPFHILLQITREGVQDLSRELHTLTARVMRAEVARALAAFLRKIWDQIVSPSLISYVRPIHFDHAFGGVPLPSFVCFPCTQPVRTGEGQRNLPGLYVLSYTPTLTACQTVLFCNSRRDFVAIGQVKAAGERELPSVGAELSNIGQLVSGTVPFTRIDGEDQFVVS